MSRRNRARRGKTVPRKGTPTQHLRGTFSVEKLRRELCDPNEAADGD